VSVLVAALLQVVASGSPDAIDLTIPPSCEAQRAASDEIIVCGRRDGEPGPYRLPQLPPRDPGLPRAETGIAKGVAIAGETERADVGGFPSNRAMVRLKIKF
jgi:hypothetical protein